MEYSKLRNELYDRLRRLGYSHDHAKIGASVISTICVENGIKWQDLKPKDITRLGIKAGYTIEVIDRAKTLLVALKQNKRVRKNALEKLAEELGVELESLYSDPAFVIRELYRRGYSNKVLWIWKNKLLRAIGEDPAEWRIYKGELRKVSWNISVEAV